MQFVTTVAILCALAFTDVVCEKSERCREECVEDEWGDDNENVRAPVNSDLDAKLRDCKDSVGNVDIACQNRLKEKKNSINNVDTHGITNQHKSCSHCKKNQICVGFPEDDFVEPECLDIEDDCPCGDQCDLDENCEQVFGNRFNCVPDPDFNVCDICTESEICLGFPGDDVPKDCYEADDDMLCAGLCENNEVCVHLKDNEYECKSLKASKPNK